MNFLIKAAAPCDLNGLYLSSGDTVEVAIAEHTLPLISSILRECSRGNLYFKNPNAVRYATDELYTSIERVLRETPPSQAAIVIMELFKTHIERFL